MLLYDLFLAPGRFLCNRSSRTRKKTRYQAKSVNRGPVVPLSIVTWLILACLIVIVVNRVGTSPLPKGQESAAQIAEGTSAEAPEPAQPASPTETSGMAQGAQAATAGSSGPIPLTGTPGSNGTSGPAASASSTQATTEIWLVIVESIPKRARAEAEQSQTRYKRRGLDIELLDTDAYPLLKSGMWALAMGPFDTKAEADVAAAELKPKVRELMVRRGL